MTSGVANSPGKARGIRHRKTGDVACVAVYLSVSLARAAKLAALDRGTSVSAVVSDALCAHLAAKQEPE